MRNLSGRDDQLHDARQITSRMDEIQAVILRVKLMHLDNWLEERHDIAALYMQRLPEKVICVSSRLLILTVAPRPQRSS
jgi:dTDP-4-amino-4,6-dideoxygalactose transaminase